VSSSRSSQHADKVVHIIDTYGLPLPCATLQGLRRDLIEMNPSGRERFAEEDAALYLADRLHAMASAELHACGEPGEIGAALRAWMKFTRQVMYRTDLGLVNLVLFKAEILPLIDDMERLLQENTPAADPCRGDPAARGSVIPT